jgi:hypothetical protein
MVAPTAFGQNYLFCAPPPARTEETVPVQNGGSARSLPDLARHSA